MNAESCAYTLVAARSGGFLDFEDSIRSSKVLQGQENVGYVPPLYGCDATNHPLDFEMRAPIHQNLASTGLDKGNFNSFVARPTTAYTGFMESDRFPKVLQGQEICPLRSFTGKMDLKLGAWGKQPNIGCNSFNMYPATKPSFYPLPSENLRNVFFPYNDVYKNGQDPTMRAYAANFQRENVQFNPSSIPKRVVVDDVRKPIILNEHKPAETIISPAFNSTIRNQKEETFGGTVAGCKLFGFSLTGETPSPSSQNSGKRSCTKVRYSRVKIIV